MIGQIKCIISWILCIDLFVLNFTVSHSLSVSNVIKLKKNQKQINHCENWQFQCKNGQCIAKPFICDGLKDCSDESDETDVQCRNKSLLMKCDKLHFQCKYGACIEKKYKCDGLKQCIDGSDESPDTCNDLEDKSERIRIRRDSTNKSCTAPASSTDKTVAFLCNGKSCQPSNGYVPELTVATITCADDFYRETLDGSQSHVCHNNRWLPPITQCLKKCDKLNPVNVILQCHREGVIIHNCDENSILLAGTKVRPSCKSTYKYDSPPSYFEITCNKDGKWDNVLLPCVPECGKPYTSPRLTIAGGKPETIGGSPWHVAIFEKKPQILICGGTIISEHLILSAAHCFSNDGDKCEGTDCVDDFEVIIGKYTNNYTVQDNVYQRTMKIKEIRFPKKGYFALTTYYAADIVILILRDQIPISPAVLPACINWIDVKDGKYPSEGEPGKVVGWGRTENGTLSTILRNISLPFISYRRCVNMVERDFKRFVTFDKFCAGTGNRTGPTALDGDSGGGLLFEEKGLFYLRGIVSVKSSSSNSVTVFSDLTEHIDWIASVRNNIEKKSQTNKIQLSNDIDFTTIRQVCDVENVKKLSPDDIVLDLQSHEFASAEQKLQQSNNGTYNYVVKKVYDHQIGNFELLLRFGDSVREADQKLKIYDALYYEMRTSGHKDTQKLLQLSHSIEKEIVNRTKDQTTVAAQSLFDILWNVIQEEVNPVASSILKNGPAIDLGGGGCVQCIIDTCKQAVKNLWSKLSMLDILTRARKNLQNVEAQIAFQVAVFHELEHKNEIYSHKSIILARHIKLTMDDGNYQSISSEIRSRHDEIKNKLPQSLKNLLISSAICLRSVDSKELLYASDVFHPDSNNTRFVFTWTPARNMSDTGRLKWTANFLDNFQIQFRNVALGQMLYGEGWFYDSVRRYVFTWNELSDICEEKNCRWNVEIEGDFIYLRNAQHNNEYLFADLHEKKDSNNRYVFTHVTNKKSNSAYRWEIVDCSR